MLAKTTFGSSTVMVVVLEEVLVPSETVVVTVYVPGVSNTCAATGPLATFLLAPTLDPCDQVPADESPKFQVYSRS